jgi:putative zinc finger protein
MVVNCEHVWREISNYLENDVDPATRAAMESHFKECKHCTAVLNGTRNVVQLYGDDRLFELPAGFDQRLQRRLAQHSSSRWFGGARSFWILAVAAVGLLAGGVALGNSAVFRQPELRSDHAQPSHRIPPSLMVAVSTEGKLFHVPGCKFLHRHDDESPELITAAEAMREGFTPCSRCLRQYLTSRVECPRVQPGPEVATGTRHAGVLLRRSDVYTAP